MKDKHEKIKELQKRLKELVKEVNEIVDEVVLLSQPDPPGTPPPKKPDPE